MSPEPGTVSSFEETTWSLFSLEMKISQRGKIEPYCMILEETWAGKGILEWEQKHGICQGAIHVSWNFFPGCIAITCEWDIACSKTTSSSSPEARAVTGAGDGKNKDIPASVMVFNLVTTEPQSWKCALRCEGVGSAGMRAPVTAAATVLSQFWVLSLLGWQGGVQSSTFTFPYA